MSWGGSDHGSVQYRASSVGVPVTIGPSLVLVQSHSKSIYRGLYSTKATTSGVCFCCKEMGTCGVTKSNEKTKPSKSDTTVPTEPMIYYQLASTREYIVHAEPCLNVEELSAVQVAKLLDKSIGSFEDWLVEFSVHHDAMKETGREPDQLMTAITAMSQVSRAPISKSKPIMSSLASKFEMELGLQDKDDLDGMLSAGQRLEVSYSSV